MANESICSIEAQGKTRDIIRLIQQVFNDDDFDFEKITPMPGAISEKLGTEMYTDWLSENWGTKWDGPLEPNWELSALDKERSSVCVTYAIASGYESDGPQPIVAKIAKEFPELVFTYESAGLNDRYGNYELFRDGKQVSNVTFEGDDFVKFAKETFGFDPNGDEPDESNVRKGKKPRV